MYKLNTEYVKESVVGNSFIQERGSYEGKIIQAVHFTAQSGSKGIDFIFKANDGRKARFTLYTQNANGEELYGFKQLNKLMYTLRTKNTTSQEINGDYYDPIVKRVVTKPLQQAPELLNKELGLLLTVEHYKKQDGSDGKNMVFVESFTPDTGLTSAEEANGIKEPKERLYILEHMKDRYRKDTTTANSGFSSNAPAPKANSVNDMSDDDDMPF